MQSAWRPFLQNQHTAADPLPQSIAGCAGGSVMNMTQRREAPGTGGWGEAPTRPVRVGLARKAVIGRARSPLTVYPRARAVWGWQECKRFLMGVPGSPSDGRSWVPAAAFERAGREAWDAAPGITPGWMRIRTDSGSCRRSLPVSVGPTIRYSRDVYLLDLSTVDWYGELDAGNIWLEMPIQD